MGDKRIRIEKCNLQEGKLSFLPINSHLTLTMLNQICAWRQSSSWYKRPRSPQSSKTLIWPRSWRSNSIRTSSPLGSALSAKTLAATFHSKKNTCFTSISTRQRFYSGEQAD